MATAEHRSANITAWSLKKSIFVASFPSQSQAPMASARADCTHKLRTHRPLPPRMALTRRVRVRQLEVRERRAEVARGLRLDLALEDRDQRAERLDPRLRLVERLRLELRVGQRRERRHRREQELA